MANQSLDTNTPLSEKNPLIGNNNGSKDLAADLIRKKLDSIYFEEPSASEEVAEIKDAKKLSKHQKYIEDLRTSGKDLAFIQTAWHQYYVNLPSEEKFEVWQEFYAANKNSHFQQFLDADHHGPDLSNSSTVLKRQGSKDHRRPHSIREDLKDQIKASVSRKKPSHLRSIIFGLSVGSSVIVIFLFGFFNQLIIAPFIQPSQHVGSLPLIISSTTVPTTTTPEVIVPKINVEIPVNYTLTTDDESVIENALEDGVIHYPSTVNPGENGNAAFFGHSSNNIFNPGKYKFAFVLLHTLVKGDTFYLTYHQTVYVYQVIDTKIVSPNDTAVLNDTEGHVATATLITCDPPGTSINRLVVTGVQISPNPAGNSAGTYSSVASPNQLAGNGPSLWSRLWNDLF